MIYFTVGISGSGKTTFRNKFLAENPNVKIICMDDIRQSVCGDVNDQSQNKKVFSIAKAKFSSYFMSGEDIFIDGTNLDKKTINGFLTSFAECKFFIMQDSFDLELCKNRIKQDISNQVNRANVSDIVLEKQFHKFQNIYNYLKTYYNNYITLQK